MYGAFAGAFRSDGAIISLTKIMELVSKETVDVHILTNKASGFVDDWESKGFGITNLHLNYERNTSFFRRKGVFNALATLVRTNRTAFSIIRKTGSRMIHINDMGAFWHCAWGARLAGAGILWNIRAIHPRKRLNWKWILAYLSSRNVVLLSHDMLNQFVQQIPRLLRLNTRKISYIPSIFDPAVGSTPIESPERQALLQQLKLPADRRFLTVVGAFNERKNQLDLLKTAPVAALAEAKLDLLFLGDFDPDQDPYARACMDVVDQRNLKEHVHFLGFQSELTLYYRITDLLLIASKYEGVARCMMEALNHGVPVVSTDVTSAREYLEERQCGIVVDTGAIDRLWCEAIRLLASDERLHHMRQNIQNLSNTPSSSAIQASWMEIYEMG